MESTVLRDAGPNEKRCIIRHSLGFYSTIAVGALYLIPQSLAQVSRLRQLGFYGSALIDCIHQHPFLSATVQDADSNNPAYTRPAKLNIHNHFRLHQLEELDLQGQPPNQNETALLRQIIKQIHNDATSMFSTKSVTSRPAWFLDVLALSSHEDGDAHRVFISFTYSHSHGDGMSAIAFHQTFCKALQKSLQSDQSLEATTIESPLLNFPDQPDLSSKMPITLSYLLLPALGTYLPRFLTRWLGISGSISGADEHTWTGSKTFTDAKTPGWQVTTNIEILTVKPGDLARVLKLCRKMGVKLTPLLNHVIAQALSTALHASGSDTGQFTNLVSIVPVNLRNALGIPQSTMGVYGGAAYLRYNLDGSTAPLDVDLWRRLSADGQHLVQVASNTQNQPIGLLRFVSNFSSWLLAQVRQSRDCSWELSNLGNYDPKIDANDKGASVERPTLDIRIEQMFLSQPASAIGPPLTFNAVAVKGGPLNIVISWQPGALTSSWDGIGGPELNEEDEERDRKFVQQIALSINQKLEHLAETN